MTVIPMTEPGRDLEQRSNPAQQIIATIRSDEFREQLAAALPEGLSVDRFARVTQTALMDDAARQRDPAKRLTAADPASLYQAVIKCAQMGLKPDGKHAALVKRGSAVSFMPMVDGLKMIAAEHGWMIKARAVAAEDEFEFTEEPPTITHRPVRPGQPRGAFIAAYAIATHRDGRRIQRVLYAEEIAKRRAQATTQQVWEAWEEQMIEKTPARDVFADLPLDPADKRISRVINALDMGPADAAAALYGEPARASFSELPAGVQLEADAPSAQPTAGPADPTPDGGATPDGGSGDADPSAPAAAVPRPSEEDAMFAADYTPETGKYAPGGDAGGEHGMTLAQIHEAGDTTWLLTAARRAPNETLKAKAAAYVAIYLNDDTRAA